jgi:hypothetical protein
MGVLPQVNISGALILVKPTSRGFIHTKRAIVLSYPSPQGTFHLFRVDFIRMIEIFLFFPRVCDSNP